MISFCLQISNGVYIKPFLGSTHDTELAAYINILKDIANAPDVRKKIAEKFNFKRLFQCYREVY